MQHGMPRQVPLMEMGGRDQKWGQKNFTRTIISRNFLEGLKLSGEIFIGTSDIFNPLSF